MATMSRLTELARSNATAAHLIRAIERYHNRLGSQFAGAITFFSLLALIPILMFAFSALGFVLTVLRPEWLGRVKEIIAGNLIGGPLVDQIFGIIDQYLFNWRSISLLAVVAGIYAGAGWMANLKSALRAMWRPDFDIRERKHGLLIEHGLNLAILLGLMILVGLTFVSSTAATTFAGDLVDWLGWRDSLGTRALIQLLPLAAGLVSGWALFAFIFYALPEERSPARATWRGSFYAALLFGVLQFITANISGLMLAIFGVTLLGPLILSMIFLSIFARLILFMAAWIATANQPAVAHRYSPADELLRRSLTVVTAPEHWAAADRDRKARASATGEPSPESLPLPDPELPLADEHPLVEVIEQLAGVVATEGPDPVVPPVASSAEVDRDGQRSVASSDAAKMRSATTWVVAPEPADRAEFAPLLTDGPSSLLTRSMALPTVVSAGVLAGTVLGLLLGRRSKRLSGPWDAGSVGRGPRRGR